MLSGTDNEIKKAFDMIDVDGTGLVEWTEYVFSLMGEKAINFGALAVLESLSMVLKESEGVMAALREALIEAKTANQERATRNAEMRDRLTAMKGQMQESVGGVVNKMMGMLGKSVEDLMTEEQVVKILVETFKKFDSDGSGQLEYPEVNTQFSMSEMNI